MIALKRLNNEDFVLSADMIESVESTPDTMITLNNGKKMVVRNSLEEVVKKILHYKQLTHQTIRVATLNEPPKPVEKPGK
jgi:flagellar protein FlbD